MENTNFYVKREFSWKTRILVENANFCEKHEF